MAYLTVTIEPVNNGIVPRRATPGAACFDVYANERVVIQPGEIAAVRLGFKLQLPEYWEAQIRTRSGLAQRGLVVANSPGTIDSDYRGEVMALLAWRPNNANGTQPEPFIIAVGDRIAQLAFAHVPQIFLRVGVVDQNTERGEGKFGSTGLDSRSLER